MAIPTVLQTLGGLLLLVVVVMSFVLGREMSKAKAKYQNEVRVCCVYFGVKQPLPS